MTTNSDDDSDWRAALRRRLRTEPRFVYGRKAERARKKELESDKEFIFGKQAILDELVKAYTLDPVGVRNVLAAYRVGPNVDATAHKNILKSVHDRYVRRVLNRYRRFAVRFQVTLILREKPG